MWSSWDATWRDVHIVDAENHRVDVFNLTEHDLSEATNYEALRGLLIDAAGG